MRILRSSESSTMCIRVMSATVPELPLIVTLSPSLMGRPIAMKSPATVFAMTVWEAKPATRPAKLPIVNAATAVVSQDGNYKREYQTISHQARNDSQGSGNIRRYAPLSDGEHPLGSGLYCRNPRQCGEAD